MKRKIYLLMIIALIFVFATVNFAACDYALVESEENSVQEAVEEEQIQEETEKQEETTTPTESDEPAESEEPEPEEPESEEPEGEYSLWKGEGEHKIYIRNESEDEFALVKQADKDFISVNFADIQIDSIFDLSVDKIIYKTIKNAIETYSPSLITLSGDQAWSTFTKAGYRRLAKLFDGFGIPWAVVFGNHDHENADLEALGQIVSSSNYGIFANGEEDVKGTGNYSINIMDEDLESIIHTFVMIYSGSYETYVGSVYDTLEPGTELPAEMSVYKGVYNKNTGKVKLGNISYEALDKSVINWYKQTINDVTERQGSVVESTCILHIPMLEYYYAYKEWAFADEAGRAALEPKGKMRMHETIASATITTGFFDSILELGSTKNVIVGHDHINEFSVLYKGVRLTYSVKCGDECYWEDDGSMNGCTVLTIDSTGKATSDQHYYVD